jgi:very-long-chain ceramide synthase / ultra-long-chain ceramide synthase
MFHNLAACYLFGFSYISNLQIGVVIVFIHDIADIWVTLTRAFAESEYKKCTVASFLIMMVVWCYARIYLLGECIYVATFKMEVYVVSPYVQPIFGFLLTCLLLLDIYWFIVFVKIIKLFFEKGICEDL